MAAEEWRQTDFRFGFAKDGDSISLQDASCQKSKLLLVWCGFNTVTTCDT